MRIALRCLLVTLLWATATQQTLHAQSLFAETSNSSEGTLLLRDGSSIVGDFRAIDSGDAIAWQSQQFVQPFEFLIPAISAVNFDPILPTMKMEGEFALELFSGDLISGKLIDWSDGVVEFESPRFGLVRIQEQAVHRLDRIDDNPSILFSGMSGLTDWKTSQGEWKVEGTELLAQKPGSNLVGEFAIPTKAVVEFELGWTQTPNFTFSIGIDPNFTFAMGADPANPPNSPGGWSFETFDSDLILVRERPDIAAIEPIQSLAERKQLRLRVFLDQPSETMWVYLPNGKLITKTTLPPRPDKENNKQPLERASGIAFASHADEVRLKRLKIARWDGSLPLAPDSKGSRIRLTDGTAISGKVSAFDRKSRTITLRQESEDRSFSIDQLVAAEFAGVESKQARPLILALQDQVRISGKLLSIGETALKLEVPDFQTPVEIDLALIRSVAVLPSAEAVASNEATGRTGSLEIDGHRLQGQLVPGIVTDSASCLIWQPAGSQTASPFTRSASGRIVYRERLPKPTPKTIREVPQEEGLLGKIGNLFRGGGNQNPQLATPKLDEEHDLHLISGDVVPCKVKSIDERRVHFESSSAEVDSIPHSKIKALVLKRSRKPLTLDEHKKQRLLTLPRNQKSSPPTHLLYSDRGDFLRCRVNALDSEKLRVELHLNEMEIPRDRITHIIWLHPEQITKQTEETTLDPEAPLVAERVTISTEPAPLHETQVIFAGGNRSTFTPQEISPERIIGNSDVIGTCSYDLQSIDQIVFGRGIEVAARDLPFHQWVLTPAPDPLYVQAADGGPSNDGLASTFVGKPAPDFKLELLSGESFTLSEQQGKIIVLDFWATWCGPCMLTMPLMEEAMKEFDPEQVQLISVNLEERPDQIKEVMSRHNLSAKVALDRDGVVARRYSIESIPQLVIINKDGTVARLYIGGGQNVVDQFKAALTELLDSSVETKTEPTAEE